MPDAGPAIRRRTAWPVLCLGFGGLLLCFATAGAGTLALVGRVRGEEAAARTAFLQRLNALDQIRSQIYLSGTYVRDFLLSPDPAGASAQAGRLAGVEGETRGALNTYSGLLEPGEREPFLKLRAEIDDYWRVLHRTLSWSREERDRLRYAFFYEELVPRRTAMLQIADRIGAVNERSLRSAEERLAGSSDRLRESTLITFGVTLAGGIALALLTVGYTVRLERELRRRFDENARGRAELQELSARLLRAQENERRTLARELHDEIGQSLSAILMETDSAACAGNNQEIREHLLSIRSLAETTVNEVRDLALLLRPSMLDDFGLVPALNWYAREMSKRTTLNVVVSADAAADDLPDEHKTCIYRLAQEAMNNSARHGNARTVEVAVKQQHDSVLFTVQDDGVGFDTHLVRGFGLLGMEERVRRLGGRFEVASGPGQGTRIRAELPLLELSRKSGDESYSHSAG